MRARKPTVKTVLDLGLRDVGVKNEPRRFALQLGKTGVQVFALAFVGLFAICVIAAATGVGAWIAGPTALAWTAALLVMALRASNRAPIVVVKVSEKGTNQATWLMIAPLLFGTAAVAMVGGVIAIPLAAITALMGLGLWRARGYVPEVLRELRSLLAPDEEVLGDGAGRISSVRRWQEAFRLVVATDRRLLIVGSPRSSGPFVLADVPYGRVERFGMGWRYLGHNGVLSLTVAGAEGAASETHVIKDVAPANLLSIAGALRAHGVHPDDPGEFSAAEHVWEEARAGGETERPDPWWKRLFDRAAMNTPDFDRGLWLLLGLAAFTFYLNPFGVGIGAARNGDVALVAVPLICGICGYLSGTRSALAYLVPLNLLIAPAFFFDDADFVFATMVTLSAFAAVGLWIGSALRRVTPADESSGPRAARGSLRYTLSGLGLLRLSGMLLAAMAAMAVTASAAGFELTSLRLAIEERTFEQRPVDGRSNLTGGTASITYTPGPGLRELITDEGYGADGAQWELRSSWRKGYNVVSLGHYVFEPRLDNPAAVADFLADKDDEHSRLASETVSHTTRVVDGRKGYVWDHDSARGYWYYSAWFPQPVHTVRVECIARNEEDRFRRLCEEAMRSLSFR